MIPKAVWERLGVAPRVHAGNRPVLLDDDTSVRFVESGSVALYSVPVEGGRIAGTRRFLARIGSGQALFSVHSERLEGIRLAFVPAEESVLREVPLAALWSEMDGRGLSLESLVDGWTELVVGCVEEPARREQSAKASGNAELVLEEGETLASEPGHMLWITLEQGRLTLFGESRIDLAPGQGYFPLGGKLWFRSAETARSAPVGPRGPRL